MHHKAISQNLKHLNTLAVDVSANNYIAINSYDQLEHLHRLGLLQEKPIILGGGSNILFTKNPTSPVLHIKLKGMQLIKETESSVLLSVSAGEIWHDLVVYCIKQGYYGLENLALIPGTVGGAPIQNIGAYGAELKDYLHNVSVFNMETGQQQTITTDECKLSYRDSCFKHKSHQHLLITAITLKLSKTFKANLQYQSLKEHIAKNNESTSEPQEYTAQQLASAVISIRQSKLPNPLHLPNAGSFFKNTVISSAQFQYLIQSTTSNLIRQGNACEQHQIPHHKTENNNIKIPTAWLIEYCGLKGHSNQTCRMHENQAVVLINHNHATGVDILNFSDQIKQKVKQQTNIDLRLEVNVY